MSARRSSPTCSTCWDLKQAPGGLVDIEFVAQALQLIHGAEHPALIATATEAVLVAAQKAGVLPAKEADVLLPALHLYQALFQILRLCVEGVFNPSDAPRGLLERLARAGEAELSQQRKHVEADVKALATAAGFDLVVPRSRMARATADLVAQLTA